MSSTADIAAPAAATESGSFAMIRTLGVVALVSGAILALVYQGTFDVIKKNKEAQIRAAVFSVIPGATSQAVFELRDSGELTRLEGEPTGLPRVIAGYDDSGAFLGVALEAAGKGYGGELKALYGYSPERQVITGLKVLQSNETPGLGDKIKVPPFADNFTALDVTMQGDQLVHEIAFAKNGAKTEPWQIEGISGATISSKAVTAMLDESTEKMLAVVRDNLDVLKGGA